MTQIGHIVIGLIVVVAAIYLIIFVSQRLTARKVAKLLQKKEQLAEIPMRDRLVKGRQLSLMGQSLKQFQLLENKYGTLETLGSTMNVDTDPVKLGEKIVADMKAKRKALGWDK